MRQCQVLRHKSSDESLFLLSFSRSAIIRLGSKFHISSPCTLIGREHVLQTGNSLRGPTGSVHMKLCSHAITRILDSDDYTRGIVPPFLNWKTAS
jgi:hypothetical protein